MLKAAQQLSMELFFFIVPTQIKFLIFSASLVSNHIEFWLIRTREEVRQIGEGVEEKERKRRVGKRKRGREK